MRPAGRLLVVLLSAALPALLPAAARAGGYDTPMLYSARHMGMGGTAIGFVSLYHLWLKAKGLANAGTKVSSGVAWGVSITLWILLLIIGMIGATLFSSFIS